MVLISAPRRSWPVIIALSWPLVAALLYGASGLLRLGHANLVQGPVALLIPLLLLLGAERAPGPMARRWLVVGLVLLLWSALINALRPAWPGLSWGTWWLHLLAIASAAAACRIDPRQGLWVFGLAAALAAVISLLAWPVLALGLGRRFPSSVMAGFNNLNEYAMYVPPALLAWACVAWDREGGRPPRWQLVLVAVAGLHALLVSLLTLREAGLLGLLAAGGWLALRPWLYRHPRLLAGLVLGAAGVALLIAALLLDARNPYRAPSPADPAVENLARRVARLDRGRTSLLRQGAGAAVASWPWGGGFSAVLVHAHPENDDARYMVNTAGWLTQEIHNEFIQRLAETGLPGLVGMVLLIVMLAVVCWRQRDGPAAAGLEVLGITVIVALTFHGIFHQPLAWVWLGMVAGLILAAQPPGPEPEVRSRCYLTPLIWVMVGALLLLLPGAMVGAFASRAVRQGAVQALRWDVLPASLKWHAEALALAHAEDHERDQGLAALQRLERSTGAPGWSVSRHAMVALSGPDLPSGALDAWLAWHPCDRQARVAAGWRPVPRSSSAVVFGPVDSIAAIADLLMAVEDELAVGPMSAVRHQDWSAQMGLVTRDWFAIHDANWWLIDLLRRHPALAGDWVEPWLERARLGQHGPFPRREIIDAITEPAALVCLAPLARSLPDLEGLTPAQRRRALADPQRVADHHSITALRERIKAVVGERE